MPSLIESLWVRGACCRMRTEGWSATLTLSPEDLGLLPEDVDDSIVQLGRGWLAPKNMIRTIDQHREAAKHLRSALSVPFLPVPELYFVPVANMEKLERGVEEIRERLRTTVSEFASSWERTCEVTRERWAEWLGKAWERIPWEARVPAERRRAKDEFIAAGMERVRAALPTDARLRRAWAIDMTFLQLDVPRGAGAICVSAEEAAAKLISFERHRATWEEDVEGFVRETAKALRAKVADAAARVADFAARGELKPMSVRALGRVADEVEALNFLGDADLTAMIAKLREAAPRLDTAASTSDMELMARLGASVEGVAGAIRSGAAKAAEDAIASLGRTGRRAVKV